MIRHPDVILFDLLTAALDSWSLWDSCAGNAVDGRRWRMKYLELTYGCGDYRPYEDLTRQSAVDAGLDQSVASVLHDRWDELAPWPETQAVMRTLAERFRLGVVTNCSEELGVRAAGRLGVPVHLVTAERAGAYKPDARPYRLALAEMGVPAERALFVAGSPSDIGGASAAGMAVVWHNRVGLPMPPRSPAALLILPTLDALPGHLSVAP